MLKQNEVAVGTLKLPCVNLSVGRGGVWEEICLSLEGERESSRTGKRCFTLDTYLEVPF